MPPLLPNPSREPGLIPAGTETILALFDLEDLGLAIAANQWDLRAEVNMLVNVMRDGSNRDKLAAHLRYRDLVREIATTQGLLGNTQQELTQQSPDGTTVRRVVNSSSLLLNHRSPYGTRTQLPPDAIRRPEPSRSLPPVVDFQGPGPSVPAVPVGPAHVPEQPVADGPGAPGGTGPVRPGLP